MSGEHEHGSEPCREVFARLSEYLDRELDPALCAEIERHNEECAPCQAFLASLRKTVELLRDHEPVTLSDEARRAVLAEYESLRRSLDGGDAGS